MEQMQASVEMYFGLAKHAETWDRKEMDAKTKEAAKRLICTGLNCTCSNSFFPRWRHSLNIEQNQLAILLQCTILVRSCRPERDNKSCYL
jgi:hypothetical protein